MPNRYPVLDSLSPVREKKVWSIPPNEPHPWAVAEMLRSALGGARNSGGFREDVLRQSRTAIRALK